MRTYKLARILGMDLMSRTLVGNLFTIISNTRDNEDVIIDFANVYFITRSFANEFYNVFIKEAPCKVSIINIFDDINEMLSVVAKTQNIKKYADMGKVLKPQNMEDFTQAFNIIGI